MAELAWENSRLWTLIIDMYESQSRWMPARSAFPYKLEFSLACDALPRIHHKEVLNVPEGFYKSAEASTFLLQLHLVEALVSINRHL